MRYDLSLPINDLNDKSITDSVDPQGYTLRSVLIRTALFVDASKPLPTPLAKLRAYALAKRLVAAERYIELTTEDLMELQERAGVMWTPLVLGRLYDLLESPTPHRLDRALAAKVPEPSTADIPAEDTGP